MRAILEFTLPDDEDAFRAANQAQEMRSALWNLGQELRDLRKHGCEGEDPIERLSTIWAALTEDLILG